MQSNNNSDKLEPFNRNQEMKNQPILMVKQRGQNNISIPIQKIEFLAQTEDIKKSINCLLFIGCHIFKFKE